jgi:hypothetical protein
MQVIDLLDDICNYLISFIDIRSIYIFSSSSKSINEFFLDDNFWEKLSKNKFDSSNNSTWKKFIILPNNNITWKQFYREQYMQIFTYGTTMYGNKVSYHNFIQIECKDNMMMAVDINNNIYTWNHSKYINERDHRLKTPEFLKIKLSKEFIGTNTKVKKVFNNRYTIAYIDINDQLWWAESNDKYPRPDECIFFKVLDIKIKDYAVKHSEYFIIDLDNNLWKGDHRDFYYIQDKHYEKVKGPSILKTKTKINKIFIYEDNICIIDIEKFMKIYNGYSKQKLLYKHDIQVIDVKIIYNYVVFLDINNDAWIYKNNGKIIKKMAIKARSISLEAIIDMNDNVLFFDINQCDNINSFRKIPYVKGIKIDSFWGNTIIMGAKIID